MMLHDITLVQGIAISIMAIIVGIDFWLEGFFLFRPIVVSTLTGLILGDLHLGLVAGGLTELIFSGLTPAGGVQPPNPVLAGVMVPVLAHVTGVGVKASIGLALPFSFLMQYIILFYYSSFSYFMKGATKAAKEGNVGSIVRINILLTSIVALTYGVVVFLSVYLMQDTMRQIVSHMPTWLGHGFEIAGGILPAVGFALLLRILLKKDNFAYLLIGFLLMTYLKFQNLLPVALLGVAFALLHYYGSAQEGSGNNSAGKGGASHDGI